MSEFEEKLKALFISPEVIKDLLASEGLQITPIVPTAEMVVAWENSYNANAFMDWEAMSQVGRVM